MAAEEAFAFEMAAVKAFAFGITTVEAFAFGMVAVEALAFGMAAAQAFASGLKSVGLTAPSSGGITHKGSINSYSNASETALSKTPTNTQQHILDLYMSNKSII